MTFVRYDPAIEQPADDEQETIQGLIDTSNKLAGLQKKHESGHEMRTSHAKATGLLTGELIIADDLPPELAQGIASRPRRYEALIRFAQGPGELLDDKVSVHRGMSIKLLDVEGDRIPESNERSTQDLVLEPGTAFIHSTPKTFLLDFKLGVSNAPLMPQMVKSAVSDVARVTEMALESVGGKSKLLGFLGHPSVHPLAENYFSQAPMRWGDYVAKVALAVTPETLDAIGDKKIDASDDPNAFRHAMMEFFRDHGAKLDLCVQLATDLDSMPIEDASVDWPQDKSPYVAVAQLVIPPQDAYSERRRELFDERLQFQPSNSLQAHRPIGGIMRARLQVYRPMAERRMAANGHRHIEPRSISEVLPEAEMASG